MGASFLMMGCLKCATRVPRCMKREHSIPNTLELNASVERSAAILDVTQRAARIQAQETHSGLPAKLDSLWWEGLR